MRAGWILAITVVAIPAASDPWRATLEVGGEFDSNARRVESGAVGQSAAPLARVQAEVSRRDVRGGLRSVVGTLLGVRQAIAGSITSENLLTVGADLAVERDLTTDQVAVVARVTHYDVVPLDTVAGTRAYASSGADVGVRLDGGDARSATLLFGVRRLRYKADGDFDWLGPVAGFILADELWRGNHDSTLELRAGYRLEHRGYRGAAYRDGCVPGEASALTCFVLTDQLRADLHHVISVDVAYTGKQVLAGTYKFIGTDSSSFGSSMVRHRVTLSGTTPLPGAVFLTAAVTGQLDRYRDPMLVSRDATLHTFDSIDEENHSAVSVRVSRSVSACWQLEARAAIYANGFSSDERHFRRVLIYGGVTWESGTQLDSP